MLAKDLKFNRNQARTSDIDAISDYEPCLTLLTHRIVVIMRSVDVQIVETGWN